MRKYLLFFWVLATICVTPLWAQSTHETPALPADFPRFVETGNPQADTDRYNQAKTAWLLAHPEWENSTRSKVEPIVPAVQPPVEFSLPTDFPRFMDTGNPEIRQ